MEASFIQWISSGLEYVIPLGGISSALGAISALAYKAYKIARSPHDELCSQVDKLSKNQDYHSTLLEKDNDRITTLEHDSGLLLKAMVQLITHTIDGNHIDKMKEIRDEMQVYLVGR